MQSVSTTASSSHRTAARDCFPAGTTLGSLPLFQLYIMMHWVFRLLRHIHHSPPYHSFFVGMPVDSSGPITTVSSFQSCAEKQLYICFHNLSLLSAFSPCSSLYSKPFLCIFFKLYCYIPLPS